MRNLDKDHNRATKLLDLLQDDTVAPATKEEIRAWFWSDAGRNAKDAALMEQFRQMAPNTAPDETDHEKYAELTARLNIGGTARTGTRKKRNISRTPVRIAAAAILLLGISGLAYMLMNNTWEHKVAEITLSAGPTARSVQLPDGSSVELQANSELTYSEDFTFDRRVHLDGEALLSVEESTNEAGEPVPFSLTTDDLKVDVYGTVFRVIDPSGDEDTRSIVALYDGSVSVTTKDTTIMLKHGETYHYDHAARKPNVGLILAKEMMEHGFMPLLRFDESTLGNLVTSLTANYGVNFVLSEDIDLSRGKFSGDFQMEDLKSTLNILTKSSARFSFMLRGDKVVVKRK